MRVLDGAVAVFDSVAGVEPQSETVWRQADRYGVPRIAYVNKMDRLGADFDRSVETMRDRLGRQRDSGAFADRRESGFVGLVDLVTMIAVTYEDDLGTKVTEGPCRTPARTPPIGREQLIEALADIDDTLAEAYLDGRGDLARDAPQRHPQGPCSRS